MKVFKKLLSLLTIFLLLLLPKRINFHVLANTQKLSQTNSNTSLTENLPQKGSNAYIEPTSKNSNLNETTPNFSPNTTQTNLDQPDIIYFKAKILKIIPNQHCKLTEDNNCFLFKLQRIKTNQKLEILVNYQNSPYLKYLNLKPGDTVIVQNQGDLNSILSIDRTRSTIIIIILFLLVVILVSGLQGLSALLGLAITFALLLYFFIPGILQGYNPYLITAIIGFIALAVSIYFSHGINLKSHIVLLSTSISMILAWILAIWAVHFTRLTGLTSEEYISLNSSLSHPLNISKILVTVIILGVLGSIDDVAINQSAFILSFIKHNKHIPLKKVYKEAMQIGKDHSASMINTLAIVYISNALPIVLILSASGISLLEIFNRELFVEEIVKSAVVSSILLLTVPLTNIITIFIAKKFYKIH